MKKLCIALAACATLGTSFVACANEHSVSLGYAQSKFQAFTLKGLNFKYRNEWDSSLSVITSLTALGHTSPSELAYEEKTTTMSAVNAKFTYISLAVGPAYRINNFVSIYSLIGYNRSSVRFEGQSLNIPTEKIKNFKNDEHSHSMMYGAGIQINPLDNITVDLGYEGTKVKSTKDKKDAVNGFNIGVGVRF